MGETEDADVAWYTFARKPGESFNLCYRRMLDVIQELETCDPSISISQTQKARKFLSTCGLRKSERSRLILDMGGKYEDPVEILGMLKIIHIPMTYIMFVDCLFEYFITS